MWRVIVVLACVLWLGGAAFAEPVGERQFTEETAQALKAASPGLAVDIAGDLHLRFRRSNGGTGSIDLHNLYAAYRLDPSRHDDILRRIVSSFNESAPRAAAPAAAAGGPQAATQTDTAKLTSNIVPTIKSRAWFDELKAKLAPAKQEPVFEDYNKELVIVYAEDNDNRTRYLTSAEKLEVPRDKLRETALANLQRILPEITITPLEEGRVYLVGADGDYTASLLLLNKVWSDGRLQVDGDFVVALPARDVMAVAGSKDRKALRVLRSIAKKWYEEGPYSVTESLFVYRGGKFAKFGR